MYLENTRLSKPNMSFSIKRLRNLKIEIRDMRMISNFNYRVSHIKLDRVNGSKLRFGGQIRNFNKANRIFFAENARFFEYNVRI